MTGFVHGPDVFRYCSVSGGKDSTATYIWCIKQFGKDGFRAVFADTGHEHPVTINYVKNMHVFFGGPEVEIVRANFTARLQAKLEKLEKKGKKILEALRKGPSERGELFQDLIVWKGRAPSSKAQFCTEHLKMDPIREWIMRNRGILPSIGFVGIRWGESLKRSTMKKEMLNEYMDSLTIHPIIEWSEEAVISYVKDHGPLNPLYENGSARVGCYPCIHARKAELGAMPDWAWERLERYEKSVGRSWFPSGILPKTRGTKKIPLLAQVRAWSKTKYGGKEIDPDIAEKDVPACMSTWGVCE